MNEPEFVKRNSVVTDTDYVQWLSEVKKRFQESQTRAVVKVNAEMLAFYWSIGRDLVLMRAESRWGDGIVKQFALDMRETFPNTTGFSFSSVKYMKRWYAFYSERVTKVQRPIEIFNNSKNTFSSTDKPEKGQRPVDFLEMPMLFSRIPWGQHIDIISRCQTLDEALFYLQQVAELGWSRPTLNAKIDQHLFQSQGAVLSNFQTTLPAEQSRLTQQLFKDPYHFEFLSLKEDYDEHSLEEALVTNITNFLLELGQGFAYVGRQMELRIDDDTTFFPDLIFYHIPQKRYVIIELKAVKFMPEFAGKLNFYVTAADKLLRGDGDNPSVGLIICKTAKDTIVEWSLKDINKPLGVATYQLQQVVERTVLELKQQNENNTEDRR